MDRKSITLIVIGVLIVINAVFATYLIRKKINKNKQPSDLIQLEDGSKVEVKNVQTQPTDHPVASVQADAMGKIKSMSTDSITVDQYQIPTGDRQGGLNGQQNQGVHNQNRQPMTPTTIGELTIKLTDQTIFSKIQREMGRPGGVNVGGKDNGNNDRDGGATPEEITKNDLVEGDIISIWFSKDDSSEASQVASKILVRKN